MRFKIFDHTADIGIIGFGKTEEEAFANTAFGMFSILADLEDVKKDEKIEIAVSGADKEELLVNMLSELLYWQTTKGYIFSEFFVEFFGSCVKVLCLGEKISQHHKLKAEIKTVTYHFIKIEKKEDGWETRVIFDV
ncbi:MAG: archease [bacterium]|nr:archease [bacterium]